MCLVRASAYSQSVHDVSGDTRGRDGDHVSDDHRQQRRIVFVPIPFADAILSPTASHRRSFEATRGLFISEIIRVAQWNSIIYLAIINR